MTKYEELLAYKFKEYGERFNDEDMALRFVPYFNSGERIKVQWDEGNTAFGTVGVTTGWRPTFVLMHNSRCQGSSTLLGRRAHVVAVKRGNKYETVRI